MIIRSLIAISGVILSSCTMSDMYPSGTTTTGSVNQTGTILTGSMSLSNIEETEDKLPFFEDLSGSGNMYYPTFQGLETKVIPVQYTTGKDIKIVFMNTTATSMRVVVTFPSNTSSGNLRLAQIVMPDGTMDGPFGTDSTIQLAQSGRYELRFHENMMSGDPWSGKANITITLLGK